VSTWIGIAKIFVAIDDDVRRFVIWTPLLTSRVVFAANVAVSNVIESAVIGNSDDEVAVATVEYGP
jgi:hypothetical protein